jgi:hypothetical protein
MRILSVLMRLWYKFRHWQYERRCLKYFGAKPETIYLSKEDFEALQKRLAEPPDPKSIESLKKIMNRRAPWGEEK